MWIDDLVADLELDVLVDDLEFYFADCGLRVIFC